MWACNSSVTQIVSLHLHNGEGKTEGESRSTEGRKDAPPDNADLRALYLSLRAVHIRNALAKVELGILLACHALDLDQGGVRARVALCALVPQNAAFAVESIDQNRQPVSIVLGFLDVPSSVGWSESSIQPPAHQSTHPTPTSTTILSPNHSQIV